MGHGWWQRHCVCISWLLKVRDGAGSQTVEAFTSAGLEPGDVGVLGQEMARNWDGGLRDVKVEHDGVVCLQLC